MMYSLEDSNTSSSSFLEAADGGEKSQALEIGKHAVWSLSSCKPGFGVAHLRDGATETYWQYELENKY